ncbi:hypothetical protein N8T08_000565 [Aspergillus melleus]|uniref:Uncharacterized protein n=1 Tax=Aspergillus melleus TaxID=138277 RepID=A0ACC3APV7_9EURO|nr:hypothetical protein N8T08_000565 [Aspergillus melleus]
MSHLSFRTPQSDVKAKVALCLLCLILLSAFTPTSALPGRGKGIGSHRSSSGSRGSSHHSDDKKHGSGLGSLFSSDDKKSSDDDKKHGLSGLFSGGDKKDDKKDDKKNDKDDKKGKSTTGKDRKHGSSSGRQGTDDSRGRGSSRGSSRGSNRGSSRGSDRSNPFSDKFDLDNPFSDAHEVEDIFAVEDGPTPDKKPGIGIEFEASGVQFLNKKCNDENTFALKGKEVKNRASKRRKDWALTVDTTDGKGGQLSGEYILNGKKIKLGSGRAGKAADEVANDFTKKWKPHKGKKGSGPVTIRHATPKQCHKWDLAKPVNEAMIPMVEWQYQVTVPMPLGAINDVFRKAHLGEKSPLLSDFKPASKQRMIWVNENFFQANPEGNSLDNITPDTMGFLSLVVSYAKNAQSRSNPEISPKMLTTIMPRTDFASIYKDVKSTIKGDLYNLVSVLLCYKNGANDKVEFDDSMCDGDAKNPKPKKNINEMTEIHMKGENPKTKKKDEPRVRLKEWMEKLPKGQDLLAEGDAVIDNQVGGLKSAHEEVYGKSKRLVPLFEFRDIGSAKAAQFKKVVNDIEDAVLDYHKRF